MIETFETWLGLLMLSLKIFASTSSKRLESWKGVLNCVDQLLEVHKDFYLVANFIEIQKDLIIFPASKENNMFDVTASNAAGECASHIEVFMTHPPHVNATAAKNFTSLLQKIQKYLILKKTPEKDYSPLNSKIIPYKVLCINTTIYKS